MRLQLSSITLAVCLATASHVWADGETAGPKKKILPGVPTPPAVEPSASAAAKPKILPGVPTPGTTPPKNSRGAEPHPTAQDWVVRKPPQVANRPEVSNPKPIHPPAGRDGFVSGVPTPPQQGKPK